MAKRFQPLKEFGRTTKKPRLDIVSINTGRTNTAAAALKSSPNNDFWDDDDDDVILLATQVAETEAAVSAAMKAVPSSVHEITDSEITFSEFAPNVRSSTSTQRLLPPQQQNIPDQDLLSQMFGDDDDDFDLLLAGINIERPKPLPVRMEQNNIFKKPGASRNTASSVNNHTRIASAIAKTVTSSRNTLSDDDDFNLMVEGKHPEQLAASMEQNNVFKKPTASRSAAGISNNTKPQTASAAPTAAAAVCNGKSTPLSQTEARRQLATERQIKFLMNRVETLKTDNAKLSKEVSESKMKMESKDGESALLRDELRHIKQQVQSLKMEKIISTEATKNECKTKIDELSKQVEAKRSELQMKAFEVSMLKMRHADETRRFQMTMQNDSTMMMDVTACTAGVEEHVNGAGVAAVDEKNKNDKKMKRNLMKLHALAARKQQGIVGTTAQHTISEHIYEASYERGTTKKHRTLFQQELDNVQRVLAQLQLKKQEKTYRTKDEIQHYTNKLLASMCRVFTEFWSYVHNLEFPKNCRIYPNHDYKLQNDGSERLYNTLQQPHEIYDEERAISLRRYVATLSVICGKFLPELCRTLLSYRHGEYLLLQIASDALMKLSYAREICEHFGLIEAFANLLHGVLLNVATGVGVGEDGDMDDNMCHIDTKDTELLVGLLKQLIFIRPSAWIFCEISRCLLACIHLPQVLESLCCNSKKNHFQSDRMRSAYRFTNDSCILQVYAGLLEIAFPLNAQLSKVHLELLAVISLNHVHFVYYCFGNPPKFIHNLMPSYDDEDAAAHSSNSPTLTLTFDSNTPTVTDDNNAHVASKAIPLQATQSADITCECYAKLCLSVVTLIFTLLYHWIQSDKLLVTSQVAEISRISVQLLHIIFCDNYITQLLRDSEETTKHYLYLICKWWSENLELLEFTDVHKNFLKKLQSSHVMPNLLYDEENQTNATKDLAEWYRLCNERDNGANDNRATTAVNNVAMAIKNLQLMEDAANEQLFFEVLKGQAYNFQ